MPASADALYKAHVKNLRAVDTALQRIFRELNTSLSRGDEKTADALLKTAMLLLGGWAENRLKKLLFEPNGFSGAERASIAEAPSQIEMWKLAMAVGFRKRHGIPNADLAQALDITPRSRFVALSEVLENELCPLIEVRNKLAHGQWARTLNNENTDFSQEMMAQIADENAFTLKCKHRILEALAQLVHDLVAGNAAFERDFDTHFKNLENARRDIHTRSYQAWRQSMLDKFQRGQDSRRHPGSRTTLQRCLDRILR